MHELKVSPELSLLIAPGSVLASVAQISRCRLFEIVGEQIAVARSSTSIFVDWCERVLDTSDPAALTDADVLFVTFFSYCTRLNLSGDDRLTSAQFASQLTQMGLKSETLANGRVMRRGCSIRSGALEYPSGVSRLVWRRFARS